MASKVSIANRALTKLGAERLLLLSDDTKQGRTLNSMFDDVRDAELRRHRWKFAIKRDSLPALVAEPAWGYRYQYNLPTDYLSLIQANDVYIRPGMKGQALWSVEGRKILTNLPAPLVIRYVARIENTGLYDPLFVEVLACKLALEACEALTQSNTKYQALADAYEFALSEALRQDAIENPPDELPSGSWLDSRGPGDYAAMNTGDPWQAFPRGY